MTSVNPPRFHLVAGPNGAGKTTFARQYLPLFAGTTTFLNPDLIAAGLSPLAPEAAAVRAGRLLIQEFDRLAGLRQTFAVESTLSGTWLLERLDNLGRLGYHRELYYIWIQTEDLALSRVRERVREGGHDIPEASVRRRCHGSLRRLRSRYIDLFEQVHLFDNTGPDARLVAVKEGLRWAVSDEAAWEIILGGRE